MKMTAIVSLTEEFSMESIDMELFLADKANNFAQAKESILTAINDEFATVNTLIDFIVEE